jgi:hypothetical protein
MLHPAKNATQHTVAGQSVVLSRGFPARYAFNWTTIVLRKYRMDRADSFDMHGSPDYNYLFAESSSNVNDSTVRSLQVKNTSAIVEPIRVPANRKER